MAELLGRLPAVLGGHYQLERELGRGGMAIVYLAHDLKHDRHVALKILRPELTAVLGGERFLQEIRITARLDHPHILTLIDSGEADGFLYYVVPFIKGESLRDKLAREHELPIDEAIRITSQVASALECAHQHGVIHRDIKPENILIHEGEAMVADFGIALALLQAGGPRLTGTGLLLGTPQYMSPEQATGDRPLDARSDVYSLGAVLYEMLAGEPPITGPTAHAVIAKLVTEGPTPLRVVREAVPASVDTAVAKALAKNPQDRFPSAAALAAALATSSTIPAPPHAPWRRWMIVGAAAIVLAAGGGLARRLLLPAPPSPGAAAIESLAVLPLANLSGDPTQDFFADGMTEELTTELARISALRVISRTSTMQYRTRRPSLPQIARELHVEAVLEGSVRRAGDRVRISAQLVRAANDANLWAESYDGDLRDVLGLQQEVARNVAREIRVKLTPGEQTRLGRSRPVDPEAHDAYLQGRYHMNKGTEKELSTAIAHFRRALAVDPGYAPAYAGLSDCYVLLATSYRPPREVMPEAKTAALKALDLDESLSEAHASLGTVHWNYDWDWAATERELKRAIELNPNNANAHDQYGGFLTSMGRSEEATLELRRAYELDPFSLYIMGDRVFMATMARQYDLAIETGRKAIATEPNNPYARVSLALAYALTGHAAPAIAQADAAHRLDDSPLIASFRAGVYALAGERKEAERALDEIQEQMKRRYSCSFEVATAYVALGQFDRAFDWFERAYDARSDCMPFLRIDPRLDGIRSDPRYQDLARRVGFSQ